MSQEGAPQTAVSCAWETSLIINCRPKQQLKLQLERREKHRETPKQRENISRVLALWYWKHNWLKADLQPHQTAFLVPPCIAAVPGLLHPCNTSLQPLRGEHKSQKSHTQPQRGTISTYKMLHFRVIAVFIWGSWKASSLQPQARQRTGMEKGGWFPWKTIPFHIPRKGREGNRQALLSGELHTLQGQLLSWGTRLKHPRVLKSSEAKLQQCSAPPQPSGKGD